MSLTIPMANLLKHAAMQPRANLAIVLIGFLLLWWINIHWISQNPWFKLPPKPFSDGPDYEAMGWGLQHGLGLSSHFSNPAWQLSYLKADPLIYADWSAKIGPIVPRTDRPPLLPWVIAGIYQVFGVTSTAYMAVRIFLAACLAGAGALSVWMADSIVRQSGHAPQLSSVTPQRTPHLLVGYLSLNLPLIAALICFTIALFDSNVKRYMEDFLTELPAFLLTQAFLVCLLCGTARANAWKWYCLAGVMFGLMIYARSLFVAWIPGLFLLLTWLRYFYGSVHDETGGRWRRVRRAGLEASCVVLVALCVIAPWCIRNCIVLQAFHPLGTKGPVTLLGGYCDQAYEELQGNWSNEPERYWRAVLQKSFGDELKTSTQANIQFELELVQIAKREVNLWIKDNWQKIPKLVALRLYSHFNPYRGLSGLVKLMAVVGAVALIWDLPREGILLVGLVVINATVVACLYSVGGRFFVPLYGVMYVLCTVGCVSVLSFATSWWLRKPS